MSSVNWTVETMAGALRGASVSAEELLEAAMAAASSSQAAHVFLGLTKARARAEAAAAQARLAHNLQLGVFDGVPVAWKDLYNQRGERTGAGSLTRQTSAVAGQDAEVVAHLARAGSVSIGRTNTSEFAFSGIGINPHFGTPLNPWSPDVARIPGGSSCGSAVAVALGVVPVAFGTDTSGSIRVPAALTGLVGYKPSQGRISRQGVFELSSTLDSIGPLTRTARDAVLAERALRGASTEAPIRSAAAVDLHLIVPEGKLLEGLGERVEHNFDTSLQKLENAGVRITRRPVPALEAVFAVFEQHATLVGVEAACTLRAVVEADNEHMIDARVRKRLLGQMEAKAHTLHALLQARCRLMAELAGDIGSAIVAMPTTPQAAPELQPLLDSDDAFFAMNARQLRNTMIGSYLDMPGMALPDGFDRRGMPTSIMLSAVSGRDAAVLAASVAVDQWLTEGQLRPLAGRGQ